MKPLFVFDLDSTVTKCELLPMIARCVGLGDEMAAMTEEAMRGETPFEEGFPKRVDILKSIPISRARAIAAKAPLNEEIARFIRENSMQCRIVTGNLDVWIETLIEQLGMSGRCLCSRALVEGDRLAGVSMILNKECACRALSQPFIAIGDGSNDAGMFRAATFSVAFGGVRNPPERLKALADQVVWDERELTSLLKTFLQHESG